MGNFLFAARMPFFLFAAALCITFDVIRFPVIIVFHITWTIWVVITRVLGFPFRLMFAAWKNDPTLLTSGIEERFWRISRSWSFVFANYFGNFRHLLEWQWNGGTWRPSEHAHFLRARPLPRKRKIRPVARMNHASILNLNARQPLSDSGD